MYLNIYLPVSGHSLLFQHLNNWTITSFIGNFIYF